MLDSYATLDQRGRRNTMDDTLEPAENDIQVKTRKNGWQCVMSFALFNYHI